VRVVALLTTVTDGYNRVSMHGVRRELLQRQAESIGLPLHEVFIPPECVNATYEARMEAALRIHFANGVRKNGVRRYFSGGFTRLPREKPRAHRHDGAVPIWKRDSRGVDQFISCAGVSFDCCFV